MASSFNWSGKLIPRRFKLISQSFTSTAFIVYMTSENCAASSSEYSSDLRPLNSSSSSSSKYSISPTAFSITQSCKHLPGSELQVLQAAASFGGFSTLALRPNILNNTTANSSKIAKYNKYGNASISFNFLNYEAGLPQVVPETGIRLGYYMRIVNLQSRKYD